MCNGSIMDKLISFSLPLMLSGILQLMFNAVDIVVVGRFSGSEALAAVGSTTALINVFTNLFIGISLGANVLAARFYAAGKDDEMSETVHTSILLALISGIIMAFLGVIFARICLELMDTPEDVIDLSTLYMRIYFLGMPFFMLYNYGAAILRAVGDTKRPLVFLIISGCANALLNLFFVIVCHFKCGRCWNRNCDFSVDLLYPCSPMSVSDRGKLSAAFFEAVHKAGISETDIPGRTSGRNPEYGDQFFQCAAPVLRKLFWLHCNGRIYGSKQYLRISVCVCKFSYPGLHELYQSEFMVCENRNVWTGCLLTV